MKTTLITVLAASLATLASAIPAPAAAEGKVQLAPLPAGSVDGIYAGDLNEDGTTKWTLIEALNNSTASAPAAVEKRQGASGVHCAGSWVNSDDRYAALLALGDYCGPNGRFFNSRTISVQRNSVVAYGCNYRGSTGTTCWKGSTVDRLNQVSNTCGWSVAGWWSLGQGHSSYGFTSAGTLHC
ncbi:hypothetical protein QBC35DRAFT_554681 [Podospora australis]|uniref:Secreted protein n=1 Tax=Podospora australis TaxID=1536484 RepID=A0AAN6X0T2_9PEZI|nr:hypothetical protein QBC35DRAFT_554681 [Podospora australis]